MYWLGLTDIVQEGVWLDNYGNEVDMSVMSATIDNAGGTQHCLVWFWLFAWVVFQPLNTWPKSKTMERRDLWSNHGNMCPCWRRLFSTPLSICLYWSLGWWWHLWRKWHSLYRLGKHPCRNIWWERKWCLWKCNLYFITDKSKCNRQFWKVFYSENNGFISWTASECAGRTMDGHDLEIEIFQKSVPLVRLI